MLSDREYCCSLCKSVYTVNLSTKQKHKVTGLIGEKCLIKVLLNNKLSSVLFDAGALGPLISGKCLRKNFPHVDEYPVNELLDEPGSLRAQYGNQIYCSKPLHWGKRG